VWWWVVGNIVVLAVACILAGPGFVSDEDESPLIGIIAAVCIIGSVRTFAGLLEWYLVRHYSHRAILISHLVGLGFGALIGVTPGPTTSASDDTAIGGMALAVFTYALTSFGSLIVAASVALIRALRRGGRPPEPPAGHPRSLASLPALFWLNAVLIIVVAILIAPSVAEQEESTVTYGFTVGLLIALLLRLPGVWAEWWLTKRTLHRIVYGTHLAVGLLTVFIVLINYASPSPEAPAESLDLASTIGVYLTLSSAGMWAAVAVAAPVRALRRRGASVREHSPAMRVMGNETVTQQPAHPAREGASQQSSVIRATAKVPSQSPPGAIRQPQSVPDASATMPITAPVPDPIEPRQTSMRPEENEGYGRTLRLRNEITVALGVVVGLASVVQGFDSANPVQTVAVAIAVGLVGLGILYVLTYRR
jgi:hypothetical protein